MQSHGEQHHQFNLILIQEYHNTFESDCVHSIIESIQLLNLKIRLKHQVNK